MQVPAQESTDGHGTVNLVALTLALANIRALREALEPFAREAERIKLLQPDEFEQARQSGADQAPALCFFKASDLATASEVYARTGAAAK